MLMRASLVMLLVLNAGVAAWWALHAPTPDADAVTMPADVPALQLVGEATSTSTATTSPTRTPSTSVALRCWRFGPFTNPAALDAAQRAIAADVERSAIADQVVGTPRAWRVLSPQPDRATATATAQRIGAAGFSDYLVLPETGADANAIALGRYRNEAAARERVQRLVQAGFDARAEPVGARTTRWLDVAASPAFDPRPASLGIAGTPLDCAGVPRGGRYTIPGPA